MGLGGGVEYLVQASACFGECGDLVVDALEVLAQHGGGALFELGSGAVSAGQQLVDQGGGNAGGEQGADVFDGVDRVRVIVAVSAALAIAA